MFSLTNVIFWLYSLFVNAKSLIGFDSPKLGGWPPFFERFFYVRKYARAFCLWAVCFREASACRPSSVCQPYYNTAHLVQQVRERFLTVSKGA